MVTFLTAGLVLSATEKLSYQRGPALLWPPEEVLLWCATAVLRLRFDIDRDVGPSRRETIREDDTRKTSRCLHIALWKL